MARVRYVKKAQKDQGNCEKCGEPIKAGDPYKHTSPRAHRAARGYKRKRCMKCPVWKPSETTSLTALAAIYGAQETAQADLALWEPSEGADGLTSILQACAEGIREGGEAWRESAQNIEDGFGHSTSQSEELNDKADTIDIAADELEQTDIEDFDEDEVRKEAEEQIRGEMEEELGMKYPDNAVQDGGDVTDHEHFDAEEYDRRVNEQVEQAREEWADNARSQAEEAVDNVEIP